MCYWLLLVAPSVFAQAPDAVSFDAYKPDKTGSADVSDALQQAVDLCVSRRTPLHVGAGTYRLTKGIRIRGALTLRGAGKATTTARGRTRFVCQSPSLDLFTFEADGKLLMLEDFSVENLSDSAPTAGCGLRIAGADGTLINRVSVINFYDNISVESGIYWKMSQCSLFDPVRYGVRIRNLVHGDIGDMTITESEFVTNYFQKRQPVAAVQWQSGGGLRFVNNKINWAGGSLWQYGLRIVPDARVRTSDFILVGNSIENCSVHGLYVGSGAPAYLIQSLIMTGNQFARITDTSVYLDLPVRPGGADAQALQSVELSGNQLAGYWGVRIRNTAHVAIGSNHYLVSVGAVQVGGCHNVSYQPGNLKGYPNPKGHILYENLSAAEPSATAGNLLFNFSREIPAAGPTAGFVRLYGLDMSRFRGCLVTVECTGVVEGVGLFARRTTRYISRTTDQGPILKSVGPDFLEGTAAELDWEPAGETVQLRIRKKDGSGGALLHGFVRLTVTGPVGKVVSY